MTNTIYERSLEWQREHNMSPEHQYGYEVGATEQQEIDYSDDAINRLSDLIEDYAVAALACGMAAHEGEPIPTMYSDDEIMSEYYNSIKIGVSADDLRPTTMPKWIRKKLEL